MPAVPAAPTMPSAPVTPARCGDPAPLPPLPTPMAAPVPVATRCRRLPALLPPARTRRCASSPRTGCSGWSGRGSASPSATSIRRRRSSISASTRSSPARSRSTLARSCRSPSRRRCCSTTRRSPSWPTTCARATRTTSASCGSGSARSPRGRRPSPSRSRPPSAPAVQHAQPAAPHANGSAAPVQPAAVQPDAMVDPRPIAPRPADRAASASGPSQILALSAASDQALQELAARYRASERGSRWPAARSALPERRAGRSAAPPGRRGGIARGSGAEARRAARDRRRGPERRPPEGRVPVHRAGRAVSADGRGALPHPADLPPPPGPLRRDPATAPGSAAARSCSIRPTAARARWTRRSTPSRSRSPSTTALAQLWLAWGVEPAAVIGHSVGEYAAACVAGVISLEDGLPLIARRARLMQDLPAGGAMLAVRTDEATARGHLRSGSRISVAALNGPNSVVLSGDERQLEAVAASLREAGVTTVRARRLARLPLGADGAGAGAVRELLPRGRRSGRRASRSSPT